MCVCAQCNAVVVWRQKWGIYHLSRHTLKTLLQNHLSLLIYDLSINAVCDAAMCTCICIHVHCTFGYPIQWG